MNRPLWRMIAGLALFSAAFGYVEAAVVVYLRSIYAPVRAHLLPSVAPGELFPLLSLNQLRSLGTEHTQRIKIELGREFATLLMLAGAALAATRSRREWLPAFLVCFGIWDITFYLFLKLLLNWPASLLTWDILFLLPVPWVGPVIAPVLVSVSMIVSGVLVLWREHHSSPVRIDTPRWVLISLGTLMIFAAFIADFRNTSNGGDPNAFHWGVFFMGEIIALAAFGSALLDSKRPTK